MKIAHIVCVFPPDYSGGIGNVSYHEAKESAKIGHEVTVFTPNYKRKSQKNFNCLDSFPLDGSKNDNQKFVIKKITPILKYGNAAFIPQIFWQLKDFDVIHLHYPFFGAVEIVWFLKIIKRKKIKLIVQYHMDALADGLLGIIFKFNNKFILQRIIKSADKVIISTMDYAQNSAIKNLLKKYPEKFIEIPLGIDLERFKSDLPIQDLRAKYQIKNEKVLLFVGGLDQAHYFKGLNYLIEALKLVENKNWKLIVVGDGELKQRYILQAKKLNLQNNIIFVGRASDEDLPRFYNLADLFIFPSTGRSEAFGLVLLEAMACATPCLASNLPGVRTLIDDNNDGFLVEPKNANRLAEKINYFLDNSELIKQFGILAREKVLQKYNWKEINDQYLEQCYENCLNK